MLLLPRYAMLNFYLISLCGVILVLFKLPFLYVVFCYLIVVYHLIVVIIVIIVVYYRLIDFLAKTRRRHFMNNHFDNYLPTVGFNLTIIILKFSSKH